jgi:hypothetical protein
MTPRPPRRSRRTHIVEAGLHLSAAVVAAMVYAVAVVLGLTLIFILGSI